MAESLTSDSVTNNTISTDTLDSKAFTTVTDDITQAASTSDISIEEGSCTESQAEEGKEGKKKNSPHKEKQDGEEKIDVADEILQEEEIKKPRLDAYYIVLAIVLGGTLLGVLAYFGVASMEETATQHFAITNTDDDVTMATGSDAEATRGTPPVDNRPDWKEGYLTPKEVRNRGPFDAYQDGYDNMGSEIYDHLENNEYI